MDEFDERQQIYITWLSTPKSFRDPKTVGELADRLGVDPSTLWRWKQKPGFMDAVWSLAKLHVGDKLADILVAQADMAIVGRTASARLVFEVCGFLETAPPQVSLGDELEGLIRSVYNEEGSGE